MTPPSIDLAYGEARDAIAELRRNLAIMTQRAERAEADNAALRQQMKMQEEVLTGFFKVAMDRAEKAEADNAALRERAEKYEAIAVAQTEAYRKAEADNAALRQDKAVFWAELMNIATAKRFDKEHFADDRAFADWAISRAKFALDDDDAMREGNGK